MRIGRLAIVILGSLALAVAIDNLYEAVYRVSFGKASYSREAFFTIDGTSTELALDRRAIHLFLAEYERTLIVRKEGKEILRLAAAEDSGGYSRMNVYRVSNSVFYFEGFHSFDRYLLDISKPSITRADLDERPARPRFAGAFDRDGEGWRFIAASEREEIESSTSRVKKVEIH